MDWLIGLGALISLAGIAGLIWCIVLALKARKGDPEAPETRRNLQRVVLINICALGVSGLGLMLVVVGIFLG